MTTDHTLSFTLTQCQIKSLVLSNIDYGVVGSMLSEENQRLYLALCKGKRKGMICRHLDIKWHDYDNRIRELKDEIHEVMTILDGEQI